MSALRMAIAVLVALVWAVVYLVAVFSHGKTNAPPELSGVMLAVVTWLFGSELRRTLKAGAKKIADSEEPEE